MNAREILEKLLGPTREQVEQIHHLITNSRNWQEANRRMKADGLNIKFDPEHPAIKETGAAGGAFGEGIVLNPWLMDKPDFLWTVLEHEMTHMLQLQRAKRRGANPEEITDRKYARFVKGGKIDAEAYGRDPLEMQALARNAVSAARRGGYDPLKLMRRGTLANLAPMRPGDVKRFHKYAHQMAETVLGSREFLRQCRI